jgi:transcriptional regulator with XRE-family HTH domain
VYEYALSGIKRTVHQVNPGGRMGSPNVDLDLLASHVRSKIESEGLTIREAAARIGCSPATLVRLLKGSETPNYPDSTNLFKAASWVGRSIAEFQQGMRKPTSTMADVEVHLRALPGLAREDREALVAMVRAAHDAAHKLRSEARAKRDRANSTEPETVERRAQRPRPPR